MKLIYSLLLGSLLSLSAGAATEGTPQRTLQSPLEIQVSDTVEPQSRGYSYNFGNVRVNWTASTYIHLLNQGHVPFRVNAVRIYGSAFSGWTNCPRYLDPGYRCATRVNFRPWYEGSYTGRLDFDLSSDYLYVNLYGWGSRW